MCLYIQLTYLTLYIESVKQIIININRFIRVCNFFNLLNIINKFINKLSWNYFKFYFLRFLQINIIIFCKKNTLIWMQINGMTLNHLSVIIYFDFDFYWTSQMTLYIYGHTSQLNYWNWSKQKRIWNYFIFDPLLIEFDLDKIQMHTLKANPLFLLVNCNLLISSIELSSVECIK